MNILEILLHRVEFVIRHCFFYYPPLPRLKKEWLSPRHHLVGEPIKVRHSDDEGAEWYAIRGAFMRVTLWECKEAHAYVVLGQEQEGNSVVTTIQPYQYV